MPLLAEKSACPHCGEKVKKPKTEDDYLCPKCSHPGPWATTEQASAWEAREEARRRYWSALLSFTPTQSAMQELAQLAPATGLNSDALSDWHARAFISIANTLIGDQILTPDEDHQLSQTGAMLDVGWEQVRVIDSTLPVKALVSAINGGVMPEVAEPHLLPKKGEVVHAEVTANLMKEVAVREYRGGSSGFSFPIGKTGVRYRTGAVRGRMVQVGTSIEVADTGLLVVTNKRTVFMGSKKTVDMPLPKLVNLDVFEDGIRFHMSNRVNPPLFQIGDLSEFVAAVIGKAASNLE